MKILRKKWMSIVLIFSVIASSLGMGDMTVSAASIDVKLAKKSVSLTIRKSKSGTKYGTAKIKIQSGKGVKIKKVSCKVKKKGVVAVSVKGNKTPTLTVKAKKKGSTKVTVSVRYQKAGKIKTKKLMLKIMVKESGNKSMSTSELSSSAVPKKTESPIKTPMPDLSGKNANDVAVLQKIITEQRALGATISEDLDSEQYSWNVEGRLIEINWGKPWIDDFYSEDYDKNYGYGYLLTGNIDFQGLTELEKLCIGGSDNHLTSIDVSKNGNMAYLDCSWNELVSLDVSNNTSLQILNCRYNYYLSSLNVSGCTSLVQLDCCGNQITSLDLSTNAQLKMLWCGSNNLTKLDVSHNIALEWLSSSRNSISEIDVSNNLALTHLQLSYTELVTLDVSHNMALKELSCGGNDLTNLDISKNTVLEELYCEYNDLTTLDVSKNILLMTLDCRNNQLSSLDVSNNVRLKNLAYDSDVIVIGYDR